MQRFPALPGDRDMGLAVCHAENGTIETVNHAFAALHGSTPEELAGKALHEVFPLECLACFTEQPAGANDLFVETTHIRHDGSPLEVLFSVSTLQGTEGAAGRRIVQMTDRSLRAAEREKFKDTEQRLRETTTRLLSLIQTIPDLVWMKDENGRYLFCNEPFESFFGLPEYEIVGKNDHDFIEKEAADLFMENDRAAVKAGKALLREEPVVFKEDGRHATIESRKVPVFRPGGELMGVLGIGRPVTENALPQTGGELSKNSFHSLADAFPYPLLRYGADGTHRWHNRAAREQLLDPMKQFRENSPLAETPFAHSGEIFADAFATVLETGETRSCELTLETVQGGAFREFLVHLVPESDGENISGVLLVAKDVTERKNTETKLHETEAMHALIFRQSQVAISVFALERWVYKEANQSFFEHTGYGREELIEKPGVALWVDEGERDRFIEELQTTGRVEGFEFRYRRKDGTTGIAVSYAAMLELDGEWCILSENYDITEKKRLEEASREYERMLRTLTDNLPGFAYTYRMDKDGGEALLFATPGIGEIYGLSAEDAVWDLSAFHAAMHEADLPVFRESLRETAVTLAPHSLLFRIRHPEKGERWLETRMMPERAPGGSTLWHGVALDATDRIRAEEETRSGRNLLRAVQESSSHVSIYALDTEYRYLTFNTAHQTQMKRRWDTEPSVGDSFLDKVTDGSFRAFAKEKFDRVLSGETFSVVSKEALTEAPEYWENYAAPIRNDDGNVTGLSIVSVNITERVLAEKELHGLNDALEQKVGERTARLREALAFSEGVINAIPDLLFEIDAEGTYLNIWARNEQLLAAEREMMLGKKLRDVLPPDAADVAFKTIEEVDRSGSSSGNAYRLTLPDGEHWFELAMTKKESEGTYLALARDVTKRKENEKKILLLEKALEETDEMIYLFEMDDGTKPLYVSGSAARILGYTRDELMETDFIWTLDREYTPEEAAADVEILKREKHLTATRFLTAKDGRRIPVELGRTLFESGGKTYLLASARDITERMAAREALQKSEEKMRLFFERQIVGMAIISPEQAWVHINDRLCEMLGYSKEELLHTSWTGLTHPDDLHLDAAAFAKMAAGEVDNAAFEKRFLHKEGHTVIANLSFACVRLPDGSVDYILAVFEDITARKEAENAVHELNLSLRHKVEARTAQLQKALAFSEGIINAIPDLLFELDGEGRYLNVWAHDTALLAAQKEILLQNTVHDVLSPEAAKTVMEAIREAEENHRSFGKTIGIDLPEQTRWFELSATKKEPEGTYLLLSRDITDRKAAEDQLLEQNLFLDSLLNAIPVPVFFKDAETRYKGFNKAFEEFYGKTKEELIGKGVFDLFPPEQAQVFFDADADLFRHGGTQVYEAKLRDTRGADHEVMFHKAVYSDEAGTPIGQIGTILDITERKAREEQLLLKEFALDQINEAAYLIDENSMFHYVNEGACRALGYTRDELLSMGVVHIDPNSSIEWWKEHWGDIKKLGTVLGESEHKRKDGTLFPIEVSSNYFEYKGTAYSLAVVRDITERKRMEEALTQSEQKLRTLTDNMPDNIARLDLEGRYLYINPTHERTLNLSASEIIGKKIADLAPTHTEVIDAITRITETGEETVTVFQPVPDRNGNTEIHEVKLLAEKDAEGKVVSILGLGRDTTEHKRMEELLKNREQALNEAQRIARVGSWKMDMQTGAFSWSDEYLRILEIDPGSIDPDSLSSFFERFMERIHPDDRAFIEERYAHWQQTLEPYETEHRLLMPDGRVKYLLQRSETQYDEAAKLRYTLGTIHDITETRRLEEERDRLTRQVEEIAADLPGGLASYRTFADGSGKVLYANPAYYELFGFTPQELQEEIALLADRMHPEDLEWAIEAMAEAAANLATYTEEFRYNHPQRGEIWIRQITTAVSASEESVLWHGLVFDITEQKKSEEQALWLNRALKLLGQSNMALVQADDEIQLLEEICRLAVETGGYATAWAGYTHDDAAGAVRPVAQAGLSPESFATAFLGGPDAAHTDGMAGYALKTGKKVINHNLKNDPDMLALRDAGQEYRSGITLPLKNGKKVFGVLTILSEQKNAFGKEEAKLLDELAANLAYGIVMLRLRGERIHMEALVRSREEAFRTLAENSPDTIARYDRECRRTYANATFAALAGVEPDILLGKKPTDYNASEEALLYEEKIRAAFESGISQELEYTWPDHGGNLITSDIRIVPEYDERLNIVSVLATGRDITRLKSYEAEIKRNESRLKEAQRIAKVGSWELEFPGGRLSWSDEIYRIFGLDPAQSVPSYEAFLALVHPGDREKVDRAFTASLETRSPYEVEHRILMPNGRVKYIKEQGETLFDEIGTPIRSTGTVQDITGQKLAERKINIMAHHDALTNLPNRTLARKRLERAIEEATQNGNGVALLFVDLDGFKTVNDSLGHTVGDEMLKKVAERLNESIGAAGTISRQGGDEFLIILPDIGESDEAGDVAERVLQNFEKPIRIGDHILYASMSIGIAVSPYDGETFETLLQKADTAMYKAKESGKNTYMFYSESMNSNMAEHLRMQHDLKNAIDNGELELHFQPQIDLGESRITGAEALLRWHHPHNGPVPPGVFIPVAESCGLIVPIGEWVLMEACKQAARWHEQGIRITVAVNISALQFKRDNLESVVRNAVAVSGIAPEYLELELTESVMMHDTENVLQTVRNLKAIGVQLSIDDFGTGYSSLSYLKRFAVDKLKIDQSFVRDILKDPEDEAIVRAIIQMAKSLGLKTIAEGVETEEVLARIKTFECDEVQGYHYARPMEAAAFERFYRGF